MTDDHFELGSFILIKALYRSVLFWLSQEFGSNYIKCVHVSPRMANSDIF